MYRLGEYHEGPSHNPAYHAILGNQRLWNEANPGLRYGHEIGVVSRRIEKSLKRVFAGYIDPGYPQVAINFTVGYHPKVYNDGYTHTPFRFPGHIQDADRPDYMAGMFELNEWATTYATSYYWKTMERNFLTKPLIRGYRSFNHHALDIGSAPRATRIMENVAETAKSHIDFDHAVLKALLKHDTSALDNLILATETLQSNSLEELAFEIVRRPRKKLADVAKGYSSQAKKDDSRIKKTAKQAAISVITHGWQAIPGIIEINLAMGTAGPILGTGISVGVNTGLGFTLGGFSLIGSLPYPTTVVHESIHGYSLSEHYHGIMPIELAAA